MRKSDNISIPGFKPPAGWKITPKGVKRPEKMKLVAFLIPEELVKRVDELAEKLQLVYIPPLIKGKGYRSVAIRLALEDTILRFFGPRDKDNEDEIFCPYYNEMSKLVPLVKHIKMIEALDKMPEDISHNKKEIDKIIKKYR